MPGSDQTLSAVVIGRLFNRTDLFQVIPLQLISCRRANAPDKGTNSSTLKSRKYYREHHRKVVTSCYDTSKDITTSSGTSSISFFVKYVFLTNADRKYFRALRNTTLVELNSKHISRSTVSSLFRKCFRRKFVCVDEKVYPPTDRTDHGQEVHHFLHCIQLCPRDQSISSPQCWRAGYPSFKVTGEVLTSISSRQ